MADCERLLVERNTQYALSVRLGDDWYKVAEFDATDNADAFRRVHRFLPPEHYNKPIAITAVPPEQKEHKTDEGTEGGSP